MQPSRELDEAVGKALGVEPRLSWNVLNADETASCYHCDTKREAEEFLNETLRHYPDSWMKNSHVGAWEFWPNYSSDISAAWSVVQKMRERKAAFVLGSNGCSAQISAWFVDGIWALGSQQNTVPEHGDPHLLGVATADTAPLAICIAALKALGVEPANEGER